MYGRRGEAVNLEIRDMLIQKFHYIVILKRGGCQMSDSRLLEQKGWDKLTETVVEGFPIIGQ